MNHKWFIRFNYFPDGHLALIEALGAQHAVLVGHDWGAAATYVAAALAPERIERIVTAALPHLRRFLLWPTLRQLKRSRYMGFFQLHDIPERRIVADDFKWLRALIREWSPGWNFSEDDFRPLKAAFSDPERLSAALAYYRAMPRNLTDRATWALLFTPIKLPERMIRGADDSCIGPEMFEGQEKLFAGGVSWWRCKTRGISCIASNRTPLRAWRLSSFNEEQCQASLRVRVTLPSDEGQSETRKTRYRQKKEFKKFSGATRTPSKIRTKTASKKGRI
jgi:hypothetical protein